MNDDESAAACSEASEISPGFFGGQRRRIIVWSGRTKRVVVYTASLLFAPMLAMPYSKGSREFSIAVMGWAAIMILSSAYVVQGEIKLKSRSLLGNKLLAASLITLLFGVSVLVGSIVHMSTRSNG